MHFQPLPWVLGACTCLAIMWSALALAQTEQKEIRTFGQCSPVLGPNTNNVTITCQGLSADKAELLATLVTKLLANQPDLHALSSKIDDILTAAKAAEERNRQDRIRQGQFIVGFILDADRRCRSAEQDASRHLADSIARPVNPLTGQAQSIDVDISPIISAQTGIYAVRGSSDGKLDQEDVDRFFDAERAFDAAHMIAIQAIDNYGMAVVLKEVAQAPEKRQAAVEAAADLIQHYDLMCDVITRLRASLQ